MNKDTTQEINKDKFYRTTLNLGQANYAAHGKFAESEAALMGTWEQEKIYQALQAQRNDAPVFVLHCGPPYANGDLHAGHVLTEVLKDFIVRSKLMEGYRAPFIPGWDCHGLPIEWKVEQDLSKAGKKVDQLPVLERLDLYRKEAAKWMAIQREQWQRFGSMADWDNRYCTMDFSSEAGIVRCLGELFALGYVRQGYRPILWSIAEQTVLAEAELEYEEHTVEAAYVRFKLVTDSAESPASLAIWTTTPWTLPLNKAVAYGKDIDYVLLRVDAVKEDVHTKVGDLLWLGEPLVAPLLETFGITNYTVVKSQKGDAFAGQQCLHPIYEEAVPLVEGFHVEADQGTGFVHIAPPHGKEDFEIGKLYHLDTQCYIANNGTYDPAVKLFGGQHIWKAHTAILEALTEHGNLLKRYKFLHSTPVSWRSKSPLIYRTTTQWFVHLEENNLRQQTLDIISNSVDWSLPQSKNRMYEMIKDRPDWCISRQRVWGVPITIFWDKVQKKHLTDPEIFEHIAQLIEKKGVEAWYELSIEQLLPPAFITKHAIVVENLEKEVAILDVWFDSGTTHSYVVKKNPALHFPADLYVEGSDQFRGWFQSSLLTSVALNGSAPYKRVLAHGFALDGKGRKMSKSLGNTVVPQDMINRYGMDVLRMWVALSNYQEDVRISEDIIKSCAETYRRLRNTFRFLLSNLLEFDPAHDSVAYEELPLVERCILSEVWKLSLQIRDSFELYEFDQGVRVIDNFCANDLSPIYFDIRKDILYCDEKKSLRRRSCQTVFLEIFKVMVTHLAPIIPYGTDEAWRVAFAEGIVTNQGSVHLTSYCLLPDDCVRGALSEKWMLLKRLRHIVNIKLEVMRKEKVIGSNQQAEVTLYLSDEVKNRVSDINLEEFFIVSRVVIKPLSELPASVVSEQDDILGTAAAEGFVSTRTKCPRCWTYSADKSLTEDDADLCQRCGDVIATCNEKQP